eukprot:TRINITY_DN6350_c0_g1_i1.p1 TRINITY_DN6350_c0_g1~~TRINITY_DN6350_c0_g1_i1.p1  ORF type:complete len:571 (-),score=166.41 TRINITY_DN6350_c0_g1_i1:93-1805(-)
MELNLQEICTHCVMPMNLQTKVMLFFFHLQNFEYDTSREKVVSFKDGTGFISFEVFTSLKKYEIKQQLDVNPSIKGAGQPVNNIWLPCYFTAEHFSRAILMLPDALGLLVYSDPLTYKEHYIGIILQIIGQAFFQMVKAEEIKEIEWVMFMHKVRSIYAIFQYHRNHKGQTLLEESSQRLTEFLRNPNNLNSSSTVYSLIGDALISLPPEMCRTFCAALLEDSLGKAMKEWLKDKKSREVIPVWLGLLGLSSLTENASKYSINPSFAVAKIQTLKATLPSILDEKDGAKLFKALSSWSIVVNSHGGIGSVSDLLDSLFVNDDSKIVKQWNEILEELKNKKNQEAFLSDEMLVSIVFQASLVGSSLQQKGNWKNPTQDFNQILSDAVTFIDKYSQEEKQKILKRFELVKSHPISADIEQGVCSCGVKSMFLHTHLVEVWGHEAQVDQPGLYRQCREQVLSLAHYPTVAAIDAQTDKAYKKAGGTFTFAYGDTFIPGLHRKTLDLLREWQGSRGVSAKNPLVLEAVEEMLMRLRWDSRVPGAEKKLRDIVEFLWKAFLGIGPRKSNIPSALY